MRRAVPLLLAPVVAVLVGACSGTPDRSAAGPPPGCGMVPPDQVTGLVGDEVRTTLRGSLDDLRTRPHGGVHDQEPGPSGPLRPHRRPLPPGADAALPGGLR